MSGSVDEIKAGTLVKALAGRDKGSYFVAVGASGGFVDIADGRRRKVEKPKRKNVKHISPVEGQIYSGELTNRKLRRLISEYLTHARLPKADDLDGEVL
ncbi:MAG: hypothetical protein IJ806_02960 [Ruminococcus sp.]|nr:hypothetical protein [Ruminococcus sp.]